jgi:hypothetical protein
VHDADDGKSRHANDKTSAIHRVPSLYRVIR